MSCAGGVAVYKEVLYRRGVISNTVTRSPGHLDSADKTELDAILADVSELFKV